MSQGPHFPHDGQPFPHGQPSYDPVTGQPLPPGPPAYSPVDPYAVAPVMYPPQTVYPPTGFQPGFQPPTAMYPMAGQGYPAPPGYQLVPMYPMYPMPAARPSKPGGAVAAAVLAFVQSAFVLIGGVTLFSGSTGFGLGTSVGSELTVVAVLALAAGGLLIAGGTTILNRKPTLLVIGGLLSIAISVYFVIRLSDFADGLAVWVPILYAVLPVIAVALSMGSDVRAWVRSRTADL